eukprot:3299946-Rhodomonas_salina.1
MERHKASYPDTYARYETLLDKVRRREALALDDALGDDQLGTHYAICLGACYAICLGACYATCLGTRYAICLGARYAICLGARYGIPGTDTRGTAIRNVQYHDTLHYALSGTTIRSTTRCPVLTHADRYYQEARGERRLTRCRRTLQGGARGHVPLGSYARATRVRY